MSLKRCFNGRPVQNTEEKFPKTRGFFLLLLFFPGLLFCRVLQKPPPLHVIHQDLGRMIHLNFQDTVILLKYMLVSLKIGLGCVRLCVLLCCVVISK